MIMKPISETSINRPQMKPTRSNSAIHNKYTHNSNFKLIIIHSFTNNRITTNNIISTYTMEVLTTENVCVIVPSILRQSLNVPHNSFFL